MDTGENEGGGGWGLGKSIQRFASRYGNRSVGRLRAACDFSFLFSMLKGGAICSNHAEKSVLESSDQELLR